MRKCLTCKADISKRHFNAKRCKPCAEHFLTYPKHNLSSGQIKKLKTLVGKMSREDIAKEVGASVSSIKRWCRDQGGIRLDFFNRYRANPQVVQQVCEYYAKHGMLKTKQKYPHINIRSVVERYYKSLNFPSRQTRFTDKQLITLARLGGIASFTEIANYFDRPNAFAGSIRSAWQKRFGHGSMYLNGAPGHWGRLIVSGDCPSYITRFAKKKQGPTRIYLWIDVENHLRPEIPDHIREAITALAKFQKWLHGKNYRANIMRILRGDL